MLARGTHFHEKQRIGAWIKSFGRNESPRFHAILALHSLCCSIYMPFRLWLGGNPPKYQVYLCISTKNGKNPWSISRYKKSSGSGPEEGWLSYYNAGQRVAKRDLDSGALRFTAMRVSIDPRQAGSSVGWLLLGLLLLRRSLLPRTHLQDRY